VSAPDNSDIEIEPKRVAEMLDNGDDVQLIDVREDYEWDAGRITGARHIELEQLASQAETIDRERPVVFQCRIGSRSAMAAQAFRTAGYEAYTMHGGLIEWVAQGLPIEPEDGRVADH
jgi:rhodanese-related sulfurtransferase